MKVIDGLKMYSTKEVCELLGISVLTLYKYRANGMIRSVNIGKGKYTSEESLRDYLNGKATPTKEKVNK